MEYKKRGLGLIALALTLTTAPALAQEVDTEAVIVSHTDNSLAVRSRAGPLTVVLTPTTEIREVSGPLSRRTRGPETLIPGLIIKVEGNQSGTTITAEEIEYRERDWRTAIATRAGTTEQFSELRQAIIDGNEYVIREEATVLFASGSATVTEQYRQQLRQLATNAPSHGNYRISILGFADSRGNAAANERLSQRRAEAVGNYLRQSGLIQPGRVLPNSAMGEGTAAPGEAAPTSDSEARRVVVRVLTPKAQLSQQQ